MKLPVTIQKQGLTKSIKATIIQFMNKSEVAGKVQGAAALVFLGLSILQSAKAIEENHSSATAAQLAEQYSVAGDAAEAHNLEQESIQDKSDYLHDRYLGAMALGTGIAELGAASIAFNHAKKS